MGGEYSKRHFFPVTGGSTRLCAECPSAYPLSTGLRTDSPLVFRSAIFVLSQTYHQYHRPTNEVDSSHNHHATSDRYTMNQWNFFIFTATATSCHIKNYIGVTGLPFRYIADQFSARS